MPREHLERLREQTDHVETVNVLMAAEVEDDAEGARGYEVQRVDMSATLADRFENFVVDGFVSQVDRFRLREYDLQYKLDSDEMFEVDLEEVPETRDQFDRIENVEEASVFQQREEVSDRLKFYCIVVETGQGERACFYRKHSPKNVLANGIIASVVERNHYDRLEAPAYWFDEQVDFFTWEGYLYVKRAYDFRLVLREFERVQEQVESNVAEITENVPIGNAEEFLEACRIQPQMASKAAHVASQPYLEHITFEDIEETIDEFDLDVEMNEGDGRRELVFEKGVQDRWLILKLLDDDYLGSVLTERQYEVNSKVEH